MSRQWEALKSLIVRHRFTLTDIVMIGAIVAAGLFASWEYDIFPNQSAATQEHVLEYDEIFAVSTLGFALFSWSRLRAQQREIRRRRAAEAQARALAFEDPLTGLPNRRQFEAALKVALASAPGADAAHAVLMLDLNGFKRINDVHGHQAGDEALIQAALRLRTAVRDGDLVARLGGDEFAVLARHVAGADAAAGLAVRIVDALAPPVRAGSGQHRLGSGIGIALMPHDGTDAETLVRKADVALYRAKGEGRSAYRFFELDMDRIIQERERLDRDLREAIGSAAIELTYLPRMDLGTGRLSGFEAIPQWQHAELGRLDASRLFASAESAELTRELADDLLARACRDAVGWPGDVTLSFPVAAQVLQDQTFPLRLMALFGRTGLQPARLEIELPESALVAQWQAARDVVGALRQIGVRFAVTQFGTGYSSLYHLRSVAPDVIRIDRSFVQAMKHDPQSAAVVRALVGLGSGLGLTVAADGVEDLDAETMLAEQGCRRVQGSLFGGPLQPETASELARRGHEGRSTNGAAGDGDPSPFSMSAGHAAIDAAPDVTMSRAAT